MCILGFKKQVSFLSLPKDPASSSSPTFLRNHWGGTDLREVVYLMVPVSIFGKASPVFCQVWTFSPVTPGKGLREILKIKGCNNQRGCFESCHHAWI